MIACGSRYRNSLGRDKLNALNKLNAMFFPYQWSKCVVYKLLQVTSTEGTIPTTLKCCIGWPAHAPVPVGHRNKTKRYLDLSSTCSHFSRSKSKIAHRELYRTATRSSI